MRDLLPYFEQELAFLRRHGHEFAKRYPKLASSLHVSGERSDDPHIERLIESFALLSARVSKRLEDGYPEFVESILSVIYPHYLQPFPSCSIARFFQLDLHPDPAEAQCIPRGSTLKTAAVNGTPCIFRTAWNVESPKVEILEFSFNRQSSLPHQATQASESRAAIVLKLKFRHGESQTATSRGVERLFIDAELSVCAALRDALFQSVDAVHLEQGSTRTRVDANLISEVGFRADEALIDFPANAHQAYRLLTEYFAYPEKFSFFDLCLDRLPSQLVREDEFTLHFQLCDRDEHADRASLLGRIQAATLRSGCVPVVNLFSKRGEPIRLHGRSSHYPVVADVRNPSNYEISSIESVTLIRHAEDGLNASELQPIFALKHGDSAARNQGRFWMSSRNPMVAEKSPGYEMELSITGTVEMSGTDSDVVSTELKCTNRNLLRQLPFGNAGGDLVMEHGVFRGNIVLLRKPSPGYRFDSRHEGLWRLVSHLSINHLSMTRGGIDALKALFNLYDLPRSPSTRRLIDGMRAVEHVPVTAWLSGNPFACFARGIEVRLTIDEEAYVGSGIDLFARVVEAFLSLSAHVNSFVQLVLVSEQSGEELLRCKPRSGDTALL